MPISNGHTYLLTILDRYTRWPEAYPLKKMEAKTVVSVFISHWISRYGIPAEITTDQFESQLFGELSRILGVGSHKIHTTTYQRKLSPVEC